MKTPVCDFVRKYAESESLRLHMPGHKGKRLLGFESLDITEIEGADVLYSAKGIIRDSEENASTIFGTAKTMYSAEGSSLSIRAMLYLASLWGRSEGKDMTVIAARNAHRVFMSGCALLDLDVEWMYGESNSLCSCNINAEILEKAISDTERIGKKPFAVYLTSPDYLGNMLDISALSSVCRRHGILCLVDNAHGAYLGFLKSSKHPIALGAHMCADSAHKTLPAITGAAYLHISKDAPLLLCEQAERALSLFASTSPSYLILQSLDALNAYLADGYREKLSKFIPKVNALKERLSSKGYSLVGDEPLKLTVKAGAYGYTGEELGNILLENGIVCEFCDRDYIVMMLTPEIDDRELSHLSDTLTSIQKKTPLSESAPSIAAHEKALSIREALMAKSITLPLTQCKGRILADAAFSCPPAIPIVVCGELMDDSAIEAMTYYGITECRVVDKSN